MRWFRFYDDTLNNAKAQKLPGDLFKAWVNLLCMASKNEGVLPSLEDIAFHLRMTEEAANAVLETLIKVELLDAGDEIKPHDWAERQYKSDTSNDRVQKHRDRKRECNVTVTPPETETDTDTELRTPKAPQGEVVQIPDWLNGNSWKAYLDHRGKKFTNQAQKLAINQLDEWRKRGHDPTEIINKTIMNGWKGLFEPKGNGNVKPTNADTAKRAINERIAKIAADRGLT